MHEEDLISESNLDNLYQDYTEEDLARDLAYDNSRNVIINKFSKFTEIVVYKEPFYISQGTSNKGVDKSRKFYYDENNKLQPKDGHTFNELVEHMPRARRRALDNFMGIALCNKWDYFFTLTFDPKKINRKNRDDVNYAWKLFRQKLQYRFPDIIIELVSEEHNTDECLHFHGLIGNCDLRQYITPAINNKKYLSHFDYELKKKVFDLDFEGNLIPNKYYGHLLKTEFGDQIYNFTKDIYDYGFNSLISLHGNTDKLVMYLKKYMCKDYNSVGYNKRCHFHTNNVNYKEKIITKSFEPSTGQVLNELLCEDKFLKKENDKMSVYIISNPQEDFSKNNIYSINEDLDMSTNWFNMEYKPISNGTNLFNSANSVFLDNNLLDIFE